jgi:hypothetical protein
MKRSVFRSIMVALLLMLVTMGGVMSAEEQALSPQPLARPPSPPTLEGKPVPQLSYGLFFAYGVDSGSCASPGFPTFSA